MIKKQIIRITMVLIAILLCLLFFKVTNAQASELTKEESRSLGKTISYVAKDFYNKYGYESKNWKCYYYCPEDFDNIKVARANTYNYVDWNGNVRNIPSSDPQYIMRAKYPFQFECVGFVAYIVHTATGINPSNEDPWTGGNGFANPGSYCDSIHYEIKDIDERQEGDILMSEGHVAIYVGDDMMVDMARRWDNGIASYDGGPFYRSIAGWGFDKVARLKSLDGATEPPLDGGTDITPTPTPNPNEGPTPGESGGTTKPNPNLNYDADIVYLDDRKFEFNGMPTTVVNAGGHSFMYYINKIGEAFDYLFGIILNGFKVVPVGIITGLENWITDIFNSLNTVTI